jgi:RNA polymerase sigma factor (sigma-70 family)
MNSTAIQGIAMQRGSQRVSDTSVGLLGRVQQGDTEAWRDFAARCCDSIQDWCRWRHMHSLEADDIVQNSMLVVLKKIGGFTHSGRGSLRAWLRAIAWRCWSDAIARASRSQAEELNGQYELAIDEIALLDERYEQLRRMDLVKRAMVLVRQRVRNSTWEMFYRTAIGNESGIKVAAEMQVPLYILYASRSRVQRLLQREVRMLELLEESSEDHRQLNADFRESAQ